MVTSIEAVDPDIMNLAKTLGASESQASIAVLKEALNGVYYQYCKLQPSNR
jgi:ABC-type tungstate transport system substrate-binding protein